MSKRTTSDYGISQIAVREGSRLTIRRLSQGIFQTPTRSQTIGNQAAANAQSFGPLIHAESFTVQGKIAIGFNVMLLLVNSCPATIAGKIPFSSVLSVYSRSLNAFTHVLQEILKRLPPGINRDALSTILWKFWVIGISATLQHGCPRAISWCASTMRCMTVRAIAFIRTFLAAKTPTIFVTGANVNAKKSRTNHTNTIFINSFSLCHEFIIPQNNRWRFI